jgi:hypothetical protein
MKIFSTLAKENLSKAINLIFIIGFLNGCAGIPANKIKLSNYPDIKSDAVKNLDIAYEYHDFVEKREGENRAKIDITTEAKLIKLGIKKNSENQNAKCKILTSMSSGVYDFWGCPIFTNIISIPTLTVIPYYCQIGFRGGAVLIDAKTNKVLKSYELKDKVHEVWSLLMILAGFAINSLHELPSDDYGRRIVENTISEALTRSILNDASNFKECQKDQPLLPKKND